MRGEKRALALFQQAAQRVPAYRAFLRAHGVAAGDVRTTTDFKTIPPTTRHNYWREHSLPDLCWSGRLNRPLVFTSTSGSTGLPIYFCRDDSVDQQAADVHERFYRLRSHKQPTLVLVCFGMGVWIGGIITYQSFRKLARKGYPISILTPGINKREILKALRNIAPHFASVIIAGYAPFIKDVVDDARADNIDLRALNIRFIFAAESFTEKYRDHVVREARVRDPLIDTTNIYGTAELGAMANETPVAILIRRMAARRAVLFRNIFPAPGKFPTLAQYDPAFVHFEQSNDCLLITGNSAMPLIRYDIGDIGGVLSFGEMTSRCAKAGLDVLAEAKQRKLIVHRWPFVFVYERADLSASLYGVKIYPQQIKDAFLANSTRNHCTGKFCLLTRFDENQDQFLEINVELKRSRSNTPELAEKTTASVTAQLERKNAAYRELLKSLGQRVWPRLSFWPNEHPQYFLPGGKQQWAPRCND